MARPELGTKRVDPENGRKFYDLGRDPIVSPYTGTAYAPAFFDPPAGAPSRRAAPQYAHREERPEAAVDEPEDDGAEDEAISLASIEDDENEAAKAPGDDVDGDEDDEASDEDGDGDDNRILSIDEDDDSDLSDIARQRDEE